MTDRSNRANSGKLRRGSGRTEGWSGYRETLVVEGHGVSSSVSHDRCKRKRMKLSPAHPDCETDTAAFCIVREISVPPGRDGTQESTFSQEPQRMPKRLF